MDKITFDFENNTIIIDSNTEHGVLTEPTLSARKNDILTAAGLEIVDLTNTIKITTDFLNGNINLKQFQELMDAEAEAEQ